MWPHYSLSVLAAPFFPAPLFSQDSLLVLLLLPFNSFTDSSSISPMNIPLGTVVPHGCSSPAHLRFLSSTCGGPLSPLLHSSFSVHPCLPVTDYVSNPVLFLSHLSSFCSSVNYCENFLISPRKGQYPHPSNSPLRCAPIWFIYLCVQHHSVCKDWQHRVDSVTTLFLWSFHLMSHQIIFFSV